MVVVGAVIIVTGVVGGVLLVGAMVSMIRSGYDKH
jgi:hypothetical protein